jgi:predicted RNase H-like HicB family nuclease
LAGLCSATLRLLGYAFGMSELVFNVTQEDDGGFVAVAVGASIATQGDTWEELCEMVIDATKGYFRGETQPSSIRLHLEHDPVLMVA